VNSKFEHPEVSAKFAMKTPRNNEQVSVGKILYDAFHTYALLCIYIINKSRSREKYGTWTFMDFGDLERVL